MGTGIDKDQCFLAIRFLNQHIEHAEDTYRHDEDADNGSCDMTV